MLRREFLRNLAVMPLAVYLPRFELARKARVRPGDAGWPKAEQWEELSQRVGQRLKRVSSPLEEALLSGDKTQAEALFKSMKNPYFVGDTVGLTQSTGYIDAWTTKPSIYAIEAESAADVQAAV